MIKTEHLKKCSINFSHFVNTEFPKSVLKSFHFFIYYLEVNPKIPVADKNVTMFSNMKMKTKPMKCVRFSTYH